MLTVAVIFPPPPAKKNRRRMQAATVFEKRFSFGYSQAVQVYTGVLVTTSR